MSLDLIDSSMLLPIKINNDSLRRIAINFNFPAPFQM